MEHGSIIIPEAGSFSFRGAGGQELYFITGDLDLEAEETIGQACTFDNTTETITSSGHALTDDDPVIFAGGTPPAEIIAGEIYYVINSTTDTFEISTTQGGSALDFTDDGTPTTSYYIPNLASVTVPTNGTFYLNEVGLYVSAMTGGSLVTQPTVRWRASSVVADVKAPTLPTELVAVDTRYISSIAAGIQTVGIPAGYKLTADITTAGNYGAATYTGKAYFKGILV